jgi:23S rRNA pseudouridine1911/1915/1917 synthase
MLKSEQQQRVIRLQISHSVNERLDCAINAHCPELSRTLTKKIIDIGGVHVNGRRVRQCSLKVSSGDSIEIFIDGLSLNCFRLKSADIVFQDDYILVVNKPTMIDSQPTPARYKGTMYAALLLWLQDEYRPQVKPTIGMVQRLDRETSGVMIFSIHSRAHKALTHSFTERQAHKKYLALVSGCLEQQQGEFISDLARNRATNKMKSVTHGGKGAITRFRLLQQFDSCALVEVVIPTGRMHQIRVHFSEAGYPLVGDLRYGYRKSTLAVPVLRTMLHSWTLECQHPLTKKQLCFTADIAPDFKLLLAKLGWQNNVDLSTN